jgi:hypothetical protein
LIEVKRSSPFSKQPATGAYSEPVETNLHPHMLFLDTIISSILGIRLPSGLLSSGLRRDIHTCLLCMADEHTFHIRRFLRFVLKERDSCTDYETGKTVAPTERVITNWIR